MKHRYNTLNLIAKNIAYNLYYGQKAVNFENIEGLREYNFTLQKASQHSPGISAMLRVKNEEKKITPCLESIKDIFDEIIIVNNNSTDKTKELIKDFINTNKTKNIKLWDYPINVSRCGKDNESTPEHSIHSLAYFYNWCLSKCTKKWVFKWDGDMVLPKSSSTDALKILDRIKTTGLRLWNIRGQTVYLDSGGTPWASLEEINHEEMCFPNNSAIHYKKEKNWERLKHPISIQEEYPGPVFFYEIKDTREDEFSHWTSTSNLSPRKQIEYRNYQLIKNADTPNHNFAKISHQDIFM